MAVYKPSYPSPAMSIIPTGYIYIIDGAAHTVFYLNNVPTLLPVVINKDTVLNDCEQVPEEEWKIQMALGTIPFFNKGIITAVYRNKQCDPQ